MENEKIIPFQVEVWESYAETNSIFKRMAVLIYALVLGFDAGSVGGATEIKWHRAVVCKANVFCE